MCSSLKLLSLLPISSQQLLKPLWFLPQKTLKNPKFTESWRFILQVGNSMRLCVGGQNFSVVGQLHMSLSRRGWVDWRDRLARASRASHYSVDASHNYRTIGVRNADRYCKGGQITCYLIELVLLAINSTHKMKCIEKIPSYYAKNEIACRNLLIPMMRLTWSTK